MLQRLLYKFLLRNSRLHRTNIFHKLWTWASRPAYDVQIRLFGTMATIPSTYSFPLTARILPTFNNPYLELVYLLHKEKNRKLNIIDAGASIGDTFLFIFKNYPEAVNKVFCIEGHKYFYQYLELNTKAFPEAVCLFSVLSDKEELINDLIFTHESTASSQGENTIAAQPLDNLFRGEASDNIDIIKIDVDGFDGKILAGAQNILLRSKPHVIFEYHPGLILKTKNDILQPFGVLLECGYHTLLWFNKFGEFSHMAHTPDKAALSRYAHGCLLSKEDDDSHYDIIAIPGNSSLPIEDLKECKFSKNKKLPY